jgi:hypothetical protein
MSWLVGRSFSPYIEETLIEDVPAGMEAIILGQEP